MLLKFHTCLQQKQNKNPGNWYVKRTLQNLIELVKYFITGYNVADFLLTSFLVKGIKNLKEVEIIDFLTTSTNFQK